MFTQLRRPQNLLAVFLILAGIVMIIWFSLRAIRAFRHVREGPRETDVELIRDWMTVPYVSHLYRVPPDYIFEHLDIQGQENRDKSIAELNEAFAPTETDAILNQIKTIVLQFQAEYVPPEPPDPRPPDTPSHD